MQNPDAKGNLLVSLALCIGLDRLRQPPGIRWNTWLMGLASCRGFVLAWTDLPA